MNNELKIKLWSDEKGEFVTITQQFIPLRKVMAWMKLEEEVTQSIVNQQKIFKYLNDVDKGKDAGEMPELKESLTDIEIFDKRIRLIADLFDDKRVTYDSIMDYGNAMDKLIVDVQEIVMNQYSKNDESKPGKA